jgi:hypothetical protein
MQVIYVIFVKYIGLVSKNKLDYFFALGNSELASCPLCTFLKFKTCFNFQDVNPLKAVWVVGFNTSLIRKIRKNVLFIERLHLQKVFMTHNIKITELCGF